MHDANRWNKEYSRSKVNIVNLQQVRRSQAWHTRTTQGARGYQWTPLQSPHKICVLWMDTTYLSTRRKASPRDPWMKLNLRTSTISEDLGSIKSTLV